jgi:putative addiction module CopG family antidote
MSSISVQLPAELEQFVKAKVSAGQYATASDYIVALLDAARRQRSSLEAALLEGLASGPPTEWTDLEWQSIRQRMVQRRKAE